QPDQVERPGAGQGPVGVEPERLDRRRPLTPVEEPRGRDVQSAAHHPAELPPEPHDDGSSRPRHAPAVRVVRAATVSTETPESSATRAAVTARYAGSLR